MAFILLKVGKWEAYKEENGVITYLLGESNSESRCRNSGRRTRGRAVPETQGREQRPELRPHNEHEGSNLTEIFEIKLKRFGKNCERGCDVIIRKVRGEP